MRTRPFLLCPLLLALACAGARGPTARPLPSDDPRPAAQWAAYQRDAASHHALRGVARVGIDAPHASGRAKQILLVERPAQLRVEILGLLDQTLALLVTDGTRYRLARGADRRVESGDVHDALLEEVAGLALSPELAVRALLAAPADPAARLLGGATLSDGGVRVEVARPDGLERERLDFDADARLRRFARLGADGEPVLEARYDDWRVDAVAFPHELEIVDHAGGATARLSWSRVELDPVLAPALFAVTDAVP